MIDENEPQLLFEVLKLFQDGLIVYKINLLNMFILCISSYNKSVHLYDLIYIFPQFLKIDHFLPNFLSFFHLNN